MYLVARNVNSVWPQALSLLLSNGRSRPSRNGPVTEYPSPVVTQYERPQERVLFDPLRDANPFFHLFEALWILAGREDVAWPAQFAPKLKDYSDNGTTFHGAYGHRLRCSQGDQLRQAVALLKQDPGSRRVVLSLWAATADLGTQSKDLPCNTQLYVKLRDNQVHLTVCNRSNDIVWGLYGANAVQFSVIQEYLAAQLGVGLGPLTTLSDSFHAYTDNPTWAAYGAGDVLPPAMDPYEAALVCPYPLVDVPGLFDDELARFLADPADELAEMFPERHPHYRNSFFPAVAIPLYRAWRAHKEQKHGLQYLQAFLSHDQTGARPVDWLEAAAAWLARREDDAPGAAGSALPAKQAGRGGAGRRPSQVR